jgi:hypothetical protein
MSAIAINHEMTPTTPPVVLRRTFAASGYAKGSPERTQLNLDGLTSEYLPSYRYIVRRPFVMSDGTLHPQKRIDDHFRTKAEALVKLAELEAERAGNVPVPTGHPLEVKAWLCPNGSRLVELVDNTEATWERYAQDIARRGTEARALAKAHTKALIGQMEGMHAKREYAGAFVH